MNRSLALQSLRAFLACVVISLQVFGALHFSLVRHSYSAALGGVVHVHSSPLAKGEAKSAAKRLGPEAPRATSTTLACSADRCAAANAPQSVAPHFEAPHTGSVAFGDVRVLRAARLRSSAARRVWLRAPKTSPPS